MEMEELAELLISLEMLIVILIAMFVTLSIAFNVQLQILLTVTFVIQVSIQLLELVEIKFVKLNAMIQTAKLALLLIPALAVITSMLLNLDLAVFVLISHNV